MVRLVYCLPCLPVRRFAQQHLKEMISFPTEAQVNFYTVLPYLDLIAALEAGDWLGRYSMIDLTLGRRFLERKGHLRLLLQTKQTTLHNNIHIIKIGIARNVYYSSHCRIKFSRLAWCVWLGENFLQVLVLCALRERKQRRIKAEYLPIKL